MLGFKSNLVSKRGPWWQKYKIVNRVIINPGHGLFPTEYQTASPLAKLMVTYNQLDSRMYFHLKYDIELKEW